MNYKTIKIEIIGSEGLRAYFTSVLLCVIFGNIGYYTYKNIKLKL